MLKHMTETLSYVSFRFRICVWYPTSFTEFNTVDRNQLRVKG